RKNRTLYVCSRRPRSKNRKTFDSTGEKLKHPRQVWDGKRFMEKRNGPGRTAIVGGCRKNFGRKKESGAPRGFCPLAALWLALLCAQAAPIQLMSAGSGPLFDMTRTNVGGTSRGVGAVADPGELFPGQRSGPVAERRADVWQGLLPKCLSRHRPGLLRQSAAARI